MTLRPPSASSSSRRRGIDALDYEIAQEQASALGRAGRALEAALAALADYDHRREEPGHSRPETPRAALVQAASHALWCFVVQREAIGLHDPRPVLRDYRVPAEVHNRMGMIAPTPPRSSRRPPPPLKSAGIAWPQAASRDDS
jgi:plasmid stabilization system protein ParE